MPFKLLLTFLAALWTSKALAHQEFDFCVTKVAEFLTSNYQGRYTHERSLRQYSRLLGVDMETVLRGLNKNQSVVDLGMGNGTAIQQMSALKDDMPQLTGISFENFPNHELDSLIAQSSGRVRTMTGRMFSEIPNSEIGKADVITDVAGVFTYTHDLSGDLEKAISLLKPDGRMYVLYDYHQNAIMLDAQGKQVKDGMEQFISGIQGIEGTVRKNGPYLSTELGVIEIVRKAGSVVVPKLKLESYQFRGTTYPVERHFSGDFFKP